MNDKEEKSIDQLIDEWHEKRDQEPRPHMGVSMIGHPCDRQLWYLFRMAKKPGFEGRLLRLFRRGHLEEESIIWDLRQIGCQIDGATKRTQIRAEFGSHVSGSCDGVIRHGPGKLSEQPHLLEMKTHNKNSYGQLEREGMRRAKPMHYVQMIVYMYGLDLKRGLYYAICKDDDRIYTEYIDANDELAEDYIKRAKRIALAQKIPDRFTDNPARVECRFCLYRDLCFEEKPTNSVSCRTCSAAIAKEDNTWFCKYHDKGIPFKRQLKGCANHRIHPDLVPWKIKKAAKGGNVFIINGQDVKNGKKSKTVFASSEILANPDLCANPETNNLAMQFRDEFDGKVSG